MAQETGNRTPLLPGRALQGHSPVERQPSLEPRPTAFDQPAKLLAAEQPLEPCEVHLRRLARPPHRAHRPPTTAVPARAAGRYRPRWRLHTEPGATVPLPAGDVDRVDALPPAELVDGKAGDGRIAAPFPLAGHHEVQVEGGQQPHALGAGVVVDAGERLVE